MIIRLKKSGQWWKASAKLGSRLVEIYQKTPRMAWKACMRELEKWA